MDVPDRRRRSHKRKTLEVVNLMKPPLLKRKTESTIDQVEKRKLNLKLFDAINAGDIAEVEDVLEKLKKLVPIQDIRHPDTNENVLHAALAKDMTEFVKKTINSEHETIVTSFYVVRTSKIEGKRNLLHIATEKGDIEMVKYLLSKVRRREEKLQFIKQETVIDIQGQRPRLFSCLHLAAFYGFSDLIRLYLDEKIDVNHVNSKKDTALLWASRWGHIDTVRLLLEKRADPDVKNDKGSTALYWAIRYQFPKVVDILLKKGKADPCTTRKVGLVAPIIIASAYGNEEIVKMLLDHPAVDVNLKIRGGDTAIHNAAREGHSDVLKVLISKGANFDDQDEVGDTPLLLAAKHDFVHVVNELLLQGADIKARNHDGCDVWYYAIENDSTTLIQSLMEENSLNGMADRNPLCIAGSAGRCDKIQFILDMNVDPGTTDIDDNTFLHHAAMNNKYEVIEKFNSKLSLNIKNKNGDTPLHIACKSGNVQTIDALIDAKAKADIQNRNGEIPLHLVAQSERITPETASHLIDYTIKTHDWNSLNARDYAGNNALHVACKHATAGVLWEFRQIKISERDTNGFTPLHVAVRPGQPEILHMALDIFEKSKRDVSINEQSFGDGETVLHLAADQGHSDCVERLIKLGADIACADCNGDTVLHRLIKLCVDDEQNTHRHLKVLDVIMKGLVRWWCIRSMQPYPDNKDDEMYNEFKREAFHFAVYHLYNNDGLSVLDQGFKSAIPAIIQQILLMEDVTMFEHDGCSSLKITFDVTGLTPRTNEADVDETRRDSSKLPGALGKISPLISSKDGDIFEKNNTKTISSDNEHINISALEILVKNKSNNVTADILDLPPIKAIEEYYKSLVSLTFTFLMVLHIIYMSLFTYVGVDLCKQLRVEESKLGASDPETLLMYIVVPLEPVFIILYTFYTLGKKMVLKEYAREWKIEQTQGIHKVRKIVSYLVFPAVCVSYSALIFAWIGTFTTRYARQDYILSISLCVGWLLTISFTRGIRPIHYFYKLLLKMVLRDITRFMFVYLFVLMAFGFAFHASFQVSDSVSEMYASPAETLFVTFNMMIGMGDIFDEDFEIGMAEVGRSLTYTKIMYLFYIILSTIILLNLLIAMMSDSYSMILAENEVTWRIESINLGLDIETSMPFVRKLFRVKITKGHEALNKPCLDNRWTLTVDERDYINCMRTLHSRQIANTDYMSNKLDEMNSAIKQANERIVALAAKFDDNDQTRGRRKSKKKHSFKEKLFEK
ncbi:SECG-like protein [Mya arenaria]|uniref:SECG-like protein n=1 Tax=Mya arenaria TaxID=6604 RepID=A0ABY7E587_MYAAR|nr:SECG-like protein [Mya arenaria]